MSTAAQFFRHQGTRTLSVLLAGALVVTAPTQTNLDPKLKAAKKVEPLVAPLAKAEQPKAQPIPAPVVFAKLYDLYQRTPAGLTFAVAAVSKAPLLPTAAPEFKEPTAQVTLFKTLDHSIFDTSLLADALLTGFVIESAQDPEFRGETHLATYAGKSDLHIVVRNAGLTYFRARGMNARQELTDFSKTLVVTAHQEDQIPVLASVKYPEPEPKIVKTAAHRHHSKRQPAQVPDSQIAKNESKTAKPQSEVPEPSFNPQNEIVATSPSTKPPSERLFDNNFEFSVGSALTNLVANDLATSTAADLNSSADMQMKVAWQQRWNDRFATKFDVGLRTLKFDPSTNSLKNLDQNQKTLTRFTLSGENKLGSRTTLGYAVSRGGELFVHGFDSSTVLVDAIPVTTLAIKGGYEVYHQAQLSVGLNAGASYLMPTTSDSYGISSGQTLEASVSLRRDFMPSLDGGRDQSLYLNVGVRQRNQDTSVLKVTEQNIFADLLLTFPIFDDRKRRLR